MNVDGAGAAKRRRERRLRATLRHERQTVAMELAAALHHSRDGGRETYYGLRAPKTASSGGRPGVLTEPEPQGQERPWTFPRRSQVAREPQPLLHLGVGEVHDGPLVSFLLQRALLARRKEEEKERKEKEMQEMFARLTGDKCGGSPNPHPPRLQGKRKKRKKKKKLPKASSRSSCGRARRRQRQWHSRFAGFPGDVPLRAVLPSVVVWPEMLGIMAIMNQKDSTTRVVNHGICMCRVGFTGYDAPRGIFPSGVAKPRMLCILADMDQKYCSLLVPMVQTAETVESPQLQSFQVVDTLFLWRRGSFSYTVIDVPVVHVEQVHFSLVAQWQFLWSRLFVGPFTSPVAVHEADVPVVQVEQVHFPVVAQRQSPWSKLFG